MIEVPPNRHCWSAPFRPRQTGGLSSAKRAARLRLPSERRYASNLRYALFPQQQDKGHTAHQPGDNANRHILRRHDGAGSDIGQQQKDTPDHG